jgi:hypothetical protein
MTVRSSTYVERPRTKDLLKVWALRADNSSMNISVHAKQQAELRGLDVAEVADIALERTAGKVAQSFAVLVGYCEDTIRGGSNGDIVWAIVRGNTLATVMYRRSTQTRERSSFGVERVVA